MVFNDRVLSWVDFYSNRHRAKFLPGLARSGRFLPMIQRIFAEEGLPRDLAYMAHVESAYKTNAYSRAKAHGLWQFIAGTGRRYGLAVPSMVGHASLGDGFNKVENHDRIISELKAQIDLAVRSAEDAQQFTTQQVTLDYILARFGVSLPAKQPFTLESLKAAGPVPEQ